MVLNKGQIPSPLGGCQLRLGCASGSPCRPPAHLCLASGAWGPRWGLSAFPVGALGLVACRINVSQALGGSVVFAKALGTTVQSQAYATTVFPALKGVLVQPGAGEGSPPLFPGWLQALWLLQALRECTTWSLKPIETCVGSTDEQ